MSDRSAPLTPDSAPDDPTAAMRIPYAVLALTLLTLLAPSRPAAAQAEQDSLLITYQLFTGSIPPPGSGCFAYMLGSHDDPIGNGRDADYSYPWNIYPDRFSDGYSYPEEPPGSITDEPGVRVVFVGAAGTASCDYISSTIIPAFQNLFAGLPDRYAYFTPPPNQPPTARFTWSQNEAELFTIDFDASGSDDEDGEIVSYAWDFGDGETGSGVAPSHTYEEAGEYEVTLTVTDDDGDEDEATRTVTVEGPAMRYVVTVERLGATAGKTQQDAPTFQVGDTVRVHVRVENTGDLPLQNVRVLDDFAGVEVYPEDALEALGADAAVGLSTTVLDELAPGASGELIFAHEAVSVVQDGGGRVSVGTVEAEAEVADAPRRVVEEGLTCTTGDKQQQGDSQGCALFSVTDGFVVNATGDAPLGTDDDGNPLTTCDTGGEPVTMRDGTERAECTLRAAIELANAGEAEPGEDGTVTIAFDVPEDVPVITLEDAIEITATVTIDGTTQPGGVDGAAPLVELKGTFDGVPAFAPDGLLLQADGIEVRGLTFNGFEVAIAVEDEDAVIENSYVGTERSGPTVRANSTGIWIKDAPGATVRDNLISGNGNGVRIEGASAGTVVESNRIGTRADGLGQIPNNRGIYILDAPSNIIRNNLISGNFFALRDDLSPGGAYGDYFFGLFIEGPGASENRIEGNRFGLEPEGSTLNENEVDILILGAPDTIVGGTAGAARNYIIEAVRVYREASGTQIIGNYLGTDEAGVRKIGAGYVYVSSGTRNNVRENLVASSVTIGGDSNRVVDNVIGLQANGVDPLIDETRSSKGWKVFLSGTDNQVFRNKIAYGREGLRVGNARQSQIIGNEIHHNSGDGILIEYSSGGQFNTIQANALYNNGGRGISFYYTRLPNDPFDRDSGANEYQNHPEFHIAEYREGQLRVEGFFPTPLGSGDTYTINFYANRYCNLNEEGTVENIPIGEGETHLGSTVAFSSPVGLTSFSWTTDAWPEDHFVLTATATNPEGSTSEFSACQYVTDRVAQADFDPQNPSPVLDENGVQVTVTEVATGKTAGQGSATLYASSYAATPPGNSFAGAATNANGTFATVAEALPLFYSLSTTPLISEAGDALTLTYDLCLDVTDLASSVDVGDLLLLYRSAETGYVWLPQDTRVEQQGALQYACTDGLTAFGEFGVGSGSEATLAAPLLTAPEQGATDVDMGTSLTWHSVPDAVSYDLQVAVDAGFRTLLTDTTGLASTIATPDSLLRSALHYWRVRGVTATGEAGPWSAASRFTTGATGVSVEDDVEVPQAFVLEANYPNPFNPQTTIGYVLPEASPVRLVVYDVLGRQVATLVNGVRPAGRHQAIFDASGLPTGVYLYRIEASGFTQTRRMLLVK